MQKLLDAAGCCMAAHAGIFCSTVHFVGAVLLLVVRAAATETARVGRMRAVMHLVLVGLAVGAFPDVLLRGMLQAVCRARFWRPLGGAGLGLRVHLVRRRIRSADIRLVPAGMVCFVGLR